MSRLFFRRQRVAHLRFTRVAALLVASGVVELFAPSLVLADDHAPAAATSTAAGDGGVAAHPAALEALAKVGTKSTLHARGPATQLVRTGFRASAAGGEVVLQTSGAVEMETRPRTTNDWGNHPAVFVLKRCRVVRRTDRLPLDTRYFKSSVTRVSIKQRGPDLEVSVALRSGATTSAPVTRKEAGPAGSWFWVLEFPPAVEKRTETAAALP